MTGPIPLSFDVTEALPADVSEGRKITLSGWLFFPDEPALLGSRPVTMTLLAGGSYDKRYHHAVIPGHSGYSAAEYLSGLGNIVLLIDHLGVGESSRVPQQSKATRHVVALATHEAVRQFHDNLANGAVLPELPPFADVVRIGGGHSMGGMLTIIQQARHRTYDGVMIIGYTAEGVHFEVNGTKMPAAAFIPDDPGPEYSTNDRSTQHHLFHWDDVPAAVIAADDALAVETPACIGLDSIRTNIVKQEAGQIEVPIYICLGERDVSPDPHAEPGYYRASMDVTLHVLPRSAHCQTFASTRHEMWSRMHHWSRGVTKASA